MRITQKLSVAIHSLIFISEYGKEKKVTSKLLSLSTGTNPVTIRKILSALKGAGIITIPPGTGGAKVNLPLEEISLYQIFLAVEPEAKNLIGVHASPSPFCPVGKNIKEVLSKTYTPIEEEFLESLKKITLEDIIKEYHDILKN